MDSTNRPKRSRCAAEAKRKVDDFVRALSPEERILLALRLGDEARRLQQQTKR